MRALIIFCVADKPELELFCGLAARGIELEVFCDPREPEKERLRAAGITVTPLEIKSRFDWHAIRTVRAKLQEKRFDLVYSPNSRGITTAILASYGIPIRKVTYRGTMGHLSRFMPQDLLAYLNPKLDGIICNCNAVRGYLASFGIPPSRLCTIFKGHDPDWYGPRRAISPGELGLPSDAFVVGFIGNIRPVKGVDILLRAAELLREERQIHFLIVGETRDQSPLRFVRKKALESHVHFTGFRRDISDLLRLCHVTVMPSRKREGVPRAVVESMSQSIPAIVSNVGGMPELVTDGKTGLVVPGSDPQALAAAILRMYREPGLRESLGRSAREHVKENLTIEQYVNAVHHLFLNLAGQDASKLAHAA